MFSCDLDEYIGLLTQHCRQITAVWTAGELSAGEGAKLLLFADELAYRYLDCTPGLRRDGVEVIVVVDGDQFCCPWSGRTGSLAEWRWVQGFGGVAEYGKSGRRAAYRVWPQLPDAV